MKVKYLSGKKINTIVDLDEASAKSLIEDGIVEAVVADDPMEVALKSFEVKATEIADRVIADASAKAVDSFAKGLGKASSIRVGPERETLDATGGFKSLSHFLYEVHKSGRDCIQPTDLIGKWNKTWSMSNKTAYVPTGNTEGAAPDAGPAVPVQYLTEIFKMYGEQDDFMSMCFPVPMQTSSVKIPVLKVYNRANVTATSGVVPTVPAEAAAINVSQTAWEQLSLSLSKESIIVPVSNELLEDNNVALGNTIAAQAIWQLRKTINGGIVKGAGNGSSGSTNLASPACAGIIGHAATVVVTRTADGSISFADILGMYASFAFDDADYAGAYWLAHPTAIPKIAAITSGNYNVFTAPGGLQNLSVATLMGRPIISTGWCNTAGNLGDLILVDFKKYVVGYKGGINTFVSPHVFAVSDQQAFRFTMRLNGKPGLTGPITLEDNSTTVSPFVVLGHDSTGS